MSEPRLITAGRMSGLDIRYDLGEGHPLLGRRMPDLELETASGPLRVYTQLRDARPVLLNLGRPGSIDAGLWSDYVRTLEASYDGATWSLPVIGEVSAPATVLIRPDGYVAWVGQVMHADGKQNVAAQSNWPSDPLFERPNDSTPQRRPRHCKL